MAGESSVDLLLDVKRAHSTVSWFVATKGLEPVSRKSGNSSDPENCFEFVGFFFQDKSFNNFENNTMKLSANEIKLNGLRARNCATIQQVLILKICLRARKVSGSFEKQAPVYMVVGGPR